MKKLAWAKLSTLHHAEEERQAARQHEQAACRRASPLNRENRRRLPFAPPRQRAP